MPGVNCFFLPYNGHLRLSSQSPAGHTHPGWICLRKLQVQIWPPLCGILLQPLSGLQTRRQGSLIPKVLLPARPSVLLDRTWASVKTGKCAKSYFLTFKGQRSLGCECDKFRDKILGAVCPLEQMPVEQSAYREEIVVPLCIPTYSLSRGHDNGQ